MRVSGRRLSGPRTGPLTGTWGYGKVFRLWKRSDPPDVRIDAAGRRPGASQGRRTSRISSCRDTLTSWHTRRDGGIRNLGAYAEDGASGEWSSGRWSSQDGHGPGALFSVCVPSTCQRYETVSWSTRHPGDLSGSSTRHVGQLAGSELRSAQTGTKSNHNGGEFDPGSGSTLAACLMHASRAG